MIFPAKMEKTELLVFKTDADAVLEYLGRARCFQVSGAVEAEPSPREIQLAELHRKLLAARGFLEDGRELPGGEDEDRLPREEDIAEAEKICAEISPLVEKERALLERRQKAKNVIEELEVFRKLDLPLRDIETVTFLAFRMGYVAPAEIPGLKAALEGRALVMELDTAGRILAVSSKKGRFALDTELKNTNFRAKPLSEEIASLPPGTLAALENELVAAEKELDELKNEKARREGLWGKHLAALAARIAIGIAAESLKTHLASTETAYILSGWIPRGDSRKIIADLTELTRGRIAVRSYAPEEVEAVREGKEKVPVKLKHGKLLEAFSGIVVSYGSPLYGTIDPTPLVSVFFVLLFAVMFGDVGQGFVGVLAGFILGSGKIARLKSWKKFAPVFKVVGCACMVTGFLYGSVFCSETLLVRPTRFITGRLFGYEMDRFVTLLPNHGIDKILVFFAFSLGLGVVINSLGLIINIFNRFTLKDYRHAIFAKTGLVGAFFFWYVLALALRLGLGGKLSPADVPCLGIPLVLLFWGDPLYRLLFGKRPLFPDGIFAFIMEGCVEVMETVSYFISNSVSFLRVGAFALSHAVLSLIIFTLVELLAEMPFSAFFQILIIVGGNILIIVLEGLIVSIQVIRLQYYEFFSKFFTESGEAFKPFELRSPGR
ncbi:MAG: hypothetical protein FWG35_00575 [Spirochaetaceae bacterium]|nr:hypothetical protein [Spirochaetaceae bacterium]